MASCPPLRFATAQFASAGAGAHACARHPEKAQTWRCAAPVGVAGLGMRRPIRGVHLLSGPGNLSQSACSCAGVVCLHFCESAGIVRGSISPSCFQGGEFFWRGVAMVMMFVAIFIICLVLGRTLEWEEPTQVSSSYSFCERFSNKL